MLRLDVRVLAACVIGKVYFDNGPLITGHSTKIGAQRKRDAELTPLLFFFAAKALQFRFYKAMVSVALGLVTNKVPDALSEARRVESSGADHR